MTTKRKVPTTKAGKPDKRYVKSVGAKSKATGKAPTKRTQKRRAKPQLGGYSANPVTDYVIYTVESGVKYYYTHFSARSGMPSFDSTLSKARTFAKKTDAEDTLQHIRYWWKNNVEDNTQFAIAKK